MQSSKHAASTAAARACDVPCLGCEVEAPAHVRRDQQVMTVCNELTVPTRSSSDHFSKPVLWQQDGVRARSPVEDSFCLAADGVAACTDRQHHILTLHVQSVITGQQACAAPSSASTVSRALPHLQPNPICSSTNDILASASAHTVMRSANMPATTQSWWGYLGKPSFLAGAAERGWCYSRNRVDGPQHDQVQRQERVCGADLHMHGGQEAP
jgi:hypothetical protein